MEFWGVEVKSGESLKVDPGEDTIVHLSNACLGEADKDKGSEPVYLYVKFGDQKLVLGILSSEKFPQTSYDLMFEKEFELSHSWKNGSVFFTGNKVEVQLSSDNDEDSDDSDDEDIPVSAVNGKPEPEVKQGIKPDANKAKQKENTEDPRKNEKVSDKDSNGEDEEDSSESESDESDEDSSEEEPMANGGVESSEEDDSDDDDDEDDDESNDEETPKKADASNKRALSFKMTPVPEKKAKFVTPQKNDSKSGGRVATPHPSKQAGKATATNKQPVKQQTPKSGGDYSCKPCNRSFKTEDALNSHNRAKHSTK